MISKEELEALVYTNPLGLLALRSKEEVGLANSYLPYSTGFEIECDQNKDVYEKGNFTSIPNIMEVPSDVYEQRYRIPNGINGLICLYHISNEAKRSLLLNMGSGIHYHVDCTDCWKQELALELQAQQHRILEELSLWKNKGTYNPRGIDTYAILGNYRFGGGYWIRANPLKTLEFRIGEMTFEYTDWVRCIVQINRMVRGLKDNIPDVPRPVYKPVDYKAIMKYNAQILRGRVKKSREDILREKLAGLTPVSNQQPQNPDLEAIRQMIRNRTQNL